MKDLGITKSILIAVVIYLAAILLLILAFIFVGIKAFTVPGTFGSIINSILPMAAGFGVDRKNKIDLTQKFDIKFLKPIVREVTKILKN